MSTSTDYARWAEKKRAKDMGGLTLAGKVWLAYGIVLGVSGFMFVLAVLEAAK